MAGRGVSYAPVAGQIIGIAWAWGCTGVFL
jgi:hypothetical protein